MPIFSQFLQQNLFGIVVVMLAAFILWRGFMILEKQIAAKGIGKMALQGSAIFIMTPVIMVLGVNTVIQGEVVAGLLGAMLGYIFGQKQDP